MRIIKRLLAAILTIIITLGDWGSMAVLAKETVIVSENSASESTVSKNDLSLDETSGTTAEEKKDGSLSDPPAENNTLEKTDKEADLPALHIGQIIDGEKLPTAEDDFLYNLPLTFKTAANIILFTNYDIDLPPAIRETVSPEWSILRGKKGAIPGSTNLLNEADDWNGFETVTASPLFTLKEISDKENDYYQMQMLVPGETSVDEAYDYYIRAAYYPNSESVKSEAFYAAVTIPFLASKADGEVQSAANENAAKTEQPAESVPETISENDVPDETTVSENDVSGEATVSENDVPNETTVSENTTENDMPETTAESPAEAGDTDDSLQDTPEQEPITGEDALLQTPEASISDNSAAPQAADSSAALPAAAEESAPIKESVGVLTLDIESVTLHPAPEPDSKFSVTASLEPQDLKTPVIWTSSDETVATVTIPKPESAQDNSGQTKVEITALKEGTASITAECGDQKASVRVTVVPKDDNEVYDLSGDLWVDGFLRESDDLIYTGQKITQNFCIYHKETLLKEKTDYTLRYQNNINAAAWNSTKAPNVTITMKGQYSGSITLYFTIKPRDISTIDPNPANANHQELKDSPGYEQVINYAKNLNLPAPALTYNKKKLAVNRDFTCDYTTPVDDYKKMPTDYKKGDSYTQGDTYAYTVNGKGNYTGSLSMRLVVLAKNQNFNTASVTLNAKKYTYHGNPLTKAEVTITKLKIGKTELPSSLYDYEVINTNGLQGAYLNVYPNANGIAQGYHGYKQVNLKLEADRTLSKAALIEANWKNTIPFSQKTLAEKGGLFQENPQLLTFTDTDTGKTDTLVEGTDYTIKYSNAKKVGKVTVTFAGKGRYKGSLRKTYQITANTENIHFSYHWKNVTKNADGKLTIPYQKNGAIPDFVLLDQDQNALKPKTDYRTAYKNNKIPKDAQSVEMTLTVTGVGNYKGYKQEIPITVTQADIGKATLTVADKPSSTNKNAWKSAVTLTDVNGKRLAARTDYIKEIDYSYPNMNSVASPTAGTVITVTVTGCGSYKGTISGTYRIFDNKMNLSKLQVVIDPQEYTGKAITLKPEAIHIYANANDKKNQEELQNKESCYEIVEYKNNTKSGSAKVTLRGRGDYGGTKICSFKIQKKVYVKNSVNGISMTKKTHSISLLDKRPESITLTATITPKDQTKPLTNHTVIWTSSNSSIAAVEASETSTTDNKTNTVTVSAVISAKKQGQVTITAVTQDGNKRAQCKVTITMPNLTQNGQTIEGKVGDTYQLTIDPQSENMEGVTFTSSNDNIASVNEKGLITMKKMGLATIKVSIGNAAVQQCYIVVDGDVNPETDSRALVYRQESGCTDDTKAINDLLQEWENEVKDLHHNNYDYLYIPAGEYHIDPAANPGFTAGIMLRDGQSLIMARDAKLYAKPAKSDCYRIIYVSDRENVYIAGGQLIGSTGTGESGHGIEIVGCTNVHIRDVEISNCHGDGIYLGQAGSGKYSSGISITGCNLHHNKRSNLSITEASNVTIKDSDFNYAGGLSPHCGINIEPNHGQTSSNITIRNSRFKGNKGQTIQILAQVNAHVKGVTIENCKGDKSPLKWSGFGGSMSDVKEIGNNWNWNGN